MRKRVALVAASLEMALTPDGPSTTPAASVCGHETDPHRNREPRSC